jgi:hypothetical protein
MKLLVKILKVPTAKNTVQKEIMCLETQACVRFTIEDTNGDGICCGI